MSAQGKILITGASGHLGRLVLDELKNQGIKNVIATSRNIQKIKEYETDGFELRQADFDDVSSLVSAFKDAERILIISTDHVGARLAQHTNAINAAKEVGIKHIVYTSWPNPAVSKAEVSPEHLATEKLIIASGLEYTILRNYPYAENLLGPLNETLKNGIFYGSAGDGKVAYVTRKDCAAAIVGALTRKFTKNEIIDISGPMAYSYADIVQMASEIKDTPIHYRDLSENEYIETIEKSGFPLPTAKIIASFDVAYKNGDVSEVSDGVYKLTGHKPQGLPEFLSQELT